ncbi:hypothetical protein GJ654_10415 [Rhodoblastus acidophilus]|uniref:Uncharacterized protein n=1 Tax=Rhodoblastus acidophilus TaxID=1074 RepID=A0A6N8DLW7_RHOAC|nr:hypothetical protein [Rhodoblastus acidophilus]MCW2275138.1 hypothetical protein [Rhodoblastus acidophilus]MTV31407.1 hypothetical protein [Rhodoblastus acidophilus]
MKIESIIRRAGGSHIPLWGETYHFVPTPAPSGPHIADVTNPEHIGRFLSITEGFRVAKDQGEAAPAPAPKSIAPVLAPAAPAQAPQAPPAAEAPGHTDLMLSPEALAAALAAEDAKIDKPQAQDDTGAPDPQGDKWDQMERGQLVQAYVSKFGGPPPSGTRTATLAKALREAEG